MKKLLELGNEFARKSDWKDFALLKFCMCAIGVLIGVALPAGCGKVAIIIAIAVILVTYIPLMAKVLSVAKGMNHADD